MTIPEMLADVERTITVYTALRDALVNAIGISGITPISGIKAKLPKKTAPRARVVAGGTEAQILAVLKAGPMAPKAIAAAVKVKARIARAAVKRLALAGRVVMTGTTNTRRVSLA